MSAIKATKSYRKRLLIKIIYIWIILFILSLGVLAALFYINNTLHKERQVYEKTAKLIDVVSYASRKINYLTLQVRSFVIDGDPLFIARYWRAAKSIAKTKITLKYLKDLNATPKEIDLIFKIREYIAKTKLIEIHAIKLLATAYQVSPQLLSQEVSSYVLTERNQALSAEKKIKLAQDMLFNQKYTRMKVQLIDLLDEFQASVSQRIRSDYNLEVKKTNIAMTLLTILLLAQIIAIMSIIWLRAISLKTQIKRS